jgi:hypothetical protein
MKTARRNHFSFSVLVAVPVGLAALVAAGVFLPRFHLDTDLLAVALSGLIIYSFGALALLGRRRSAIAGPISSVASITVNEVPASVPAAQIRARVRLHERERLAA